MEVTLLRLLRKRGKFDKLFRAVPLDSINQDTSTILKDYKAYFDEFDVDLIEYDPFMLWFTKFRHPKLTEERKTYFIGQLRRLSEPFDETLEIGLTERLVAAKTAMNLTSLLVRYDDGDEVDLGSCLKQIVEQYDQDTERKVKTPLVDISIDAELSAVQADTGFHFRLHEINQSMRPLIPGDFLLVAARPDRGKTSFLTDNVAHFASQLEGLFGEEDRPIIWLNNEGPGKRIATRLYQSALNKTWGELIKLRDSGDDVKANYAEAIGREKNVRIYDVHDFWSWEVEDIIRATNPSMVILDMIDNIKFSGAANNNGQRTDQLLEAMYQWARVLGVKHDCVVLATSQISAEGDEKAWPLLGELKDSRTGKQGAVDAIITLGYQSNNPEMRYIGATKNKLAKEGGPKSLQLPVYFDNLRGRFIIPEEATDYA